MTSKSNKKIKRYICPYCGTEYKNNKWTFDHIIPRDLGGPKSFKIISCSSCNIKIGKGIEQTVIGSIDMRLRLSSLAQDGIKIQTRRKKGVIALHDKVGFSMGKKVKMYHDMKKNGMGSIAFLNGLPSETLEVGKEYCLIIPDEEPTAYEKAAWISLTNKIILGTCCWLWGNNFSLSKIGSALRKSIWKNSFDSIIELRENQKHAEWSIVEGNHHISQDELEKDALDNYPHHTINISKDKKNIDIFSGIVNLFGGGGFECGYHLGIEKDSFNEIEDEEEGIIIIIAKTTENTVLKMTIFEYERFKNQQIKSALSM